MHSQILLALLVSLAIVVPSALADVICEELPQDLCAYAISSESKRCVLESYARSGGEKEYQCRTSEVQVVNRISNYVETDQCVNACGVDRRSVGISSDSLLESLFTVKLCSPECYQKCTNIVDLYFNLAAGEGVSLPELCAARRDNLRRDMTEILSSGAGLGPATTAEVRTALDYSFPPAAAPTPL